MKRAKLNCGTYFNLIDNKTILENALDQDIVLDYSCLNGQCEACKVRIISGATFEARAEIGLNNFEKNQGFILSCSRYALTDLEIDGENLSEFACIKKSRMPAKIYDIKRLSNELVIISLALHPSTDLIFIPGQYVNLSYKQITRSYSIMDYDENNKILKLFIKLQKDGKISNYLKNDAKKGDLMRVYGPLGTFSFRIHKNDSKYIFFATGTGIAPFYSIIRNLESKKMRLQIQLFWGNRYPSDFIELPSTKYIDLKVHKSISRQKEKNFFNGYIQDDFQLKFKEINTIIPFICGSESMVESVKQKLISMSFKGPIYSDKFLPFKS